MDGIVKCNDTFSKIYVIHVKKCLDKLINLEEYYEYDVVNKILKIFNVWSSIESLRFL